MDTNQEPTEVVDKPKGITIRDTQETSLMNPEVYMQMKILANDFIGSKAIPQCWQTPAQVLVGLQTGLEMGMSPMESMNSLYVVNGAINIWGKAVAKRMRDHGFTIKYVGESQEESTAVVTKGKERYQSTFKFSDAEDSGYTKDQYGKYKVGWKPGQNRKLKLRYGALSEILKTYIPEVMGSTVGVAELENDLQPIQEKATVIDDSKIKAIAAAYKDEDESES